MRSLRKSLLLAVLLMVTVNVTAQEVNVHRVSDRVIALHLPMVSLSEVVILSTEKGLVAIDTDATPSLMGHIKSTAEKVFNRKDWAYVINTHDPYHHAGGNCVFKGVPVIGHESLNNLAYDMHMKGKTANPQKITPFLGPISQISHMQKMNRNPLDKQRLQEQKWLLHAAHRELLSDFERVSPSITFKDKYALDLGDVNVRLFYCGQNTQNTSFVHIVEENILIAPHLGYKWGPKEITSFAGLKDLQQWNGLLGEFSSDRVRIDLVMAAHPANEYGNKKDIQNLYAYVNDLMEGLDTARQDGLSINQARERFSLARISFKNPNWARCGLFRKTMHTKNIDKIWTCLQEDDNTTRMARSDR